MDLKKLQEMLSVKMMPLVAARGFELFEVKPFYVAGRLHIRVLVDHSQGGITIDECGELSRALSVYFEEQEQEFDSYLIEVSSPGIDRILKDLRDFRRIVGRSVMVWLTQPIDDSEYFEGVVSGVEEDSGMLILELDDGAVRKLPIQLIKKGKEKIRY